MKVFLVDENPKQRFHTCKKQAMHTTLEQTSCKYETLFQLKNSNSQEFCWDTKLLIQFANVRDYKDSWMRNNNVQGNTQYNVFAQIIIQDSSQPNFGQLYAIYPKKSRPKSLNCTKH